MLTTKGKPYRAGYLKQDQQEKPTGKPGFAWRVAWRITDADGVDLVQPWCDTKGEAIRLAVELGIILVSR